MSKAADKGKTGAVKVLARNKKARHEYFIEETLEAGMVLMGSEVKSLRASRCELGDAYASVQNGEAFLIDMQISEYTFANRFGHEPKRPRKLLLHKAELARLATRTQQKGFTLIPLSIYFKNGKVKVELGLCTHKKLHDKRDAKREADDQREIDRAMKRHR